MKNFLILLIIMTYIFISVASPIISEGLTITSPANYQVRMNVNPTPISDYESSPIQQKDIPKQPSPNIASGGGSFALSSSKDFPLDIRKNLLEASNDGYIIGEEIHVLVEIKALADNEPEDIDIYENADKNLKIIKYSEPYIALDLNDTFGYSNKVKKYYSINNTSNSFHYYIDKLGHKQSIMYEFCVIPRICGTLRTETVMRAGGRASFFSDKYQELAILARNPEFEVRADLNELEAEPNTNIAITYLIKCKDSEKIKNRSACFNISVGCLCKDSPVNIDENNHTVGINSTRYPIYAKFPSSGIYSIPELEVGYNGNSTVYLFPDRINIIPFWHKYSAEFALIVTVILLPSIIRFGRFLYLPISTRIKKSDYYTNFYNKHILKLRKKIG